MKAIGVFVLFITFAMPAWGFAGPGDQPCRFFTKPVSLKNIEQVINLTAITGWFQGFMYNHYRSSGHSPITEEMLSDPINLLIEYCRGHPSETIVVATELLLKRIDAK